jgi:dihydrofolate reductase
MIKAILACDENWGIGKAGTLPWPHNSADLKWFKQMTTGSTVVMGRKTWDSLPVKPLPNRRNIVISRDPSIVYKILQPNFACPLDAYRVLLKDRVIAERTIKEGVWIIGGASLIEGFIDIIDEFYLNMIVGDYDCDVFLPRDLIMAQFVQADVAQPNTDLNITRWIRK